MYYNYIRMSDDGTKSFGSRVADFAPTEQTQKGEKSGELVIAEPQTPKGVADIIEIHVCPICLHKCEGSAQLLEHYWGYCQKTRTYFDICVDGK
jgi:hypothetical protein